MPRDPYSVLITEPERFGDEFDYLLIHGAPVMVSANRWFGPGWSSEVNEAGEVVRTWIPVRRNLGPCLTSKPLTNAELSSMSGIAVNRLRALRSGRATRMTVQTFDRLMRLLDRLHRDAVSAKGSVESPEEWRRWRDDCIQHFYRVCLEVCVYPTKDALRIGRRHSRKVAEKLTAPRPSQGTRRS